MAWHKMTTEEQVRQLLQDRRQRFDAPANDGVVVTKAQADGATTREEILHVIDRLGDERKIIYAPAVQQALDAAKASKPLNNFNSYAAEKLILDKAEEIRFSITSGRDLADVCDWLVENTSVPLSEEGRAAKQQLRGVEQRTNEINSITNNYTAGFKIRTSNGGIKVYDRDGQEVQFSRAGGRAKPSDGGFDAMTDDEVHALYEQVMEQRRLRSMSKEELRQEINPARKAAYQASSAHLRPTPDGTQLIDPDTGDAITDKATLVRFISARNDNTARLIRDKRGVTIPALAKELERILWKT